MAIYLGGKKVGVVNNVGTKEELSVNVTPSTQSQTITPQSDLQVFNEINVSPVTSSIDSNITSANIRAGVSILGVTGNLEPDKPDQTKAITPTDYEQVVEPDIGYELAAVTVNPTPLETTTMFPSVYQQTITPTNGNLGFSAVTLEAVNSSIDSNIQSGNIRDGVTILGVTGNYAGEAPNLQSKSITITENETQVISPDSGYDGLSSVEITTNVEGSGSQGEYFVKVFDYDGTLIDEQWLDTGDTYTLPTPPVHERLTFQEWSCSAQIVNNTITVSNNDIIAGPIYTTTSGQCEFDIELTKVTGLTVTLTSSGTKDWGDGTSDSSTSHTYNDYGSYTILDDSSTLPSALFQAKSWVTAIRLSSSITSIPTYFCYNASNLRFITIPNTITSIGPDAFAGAVATPGGNLHTLIFPVSVASSLGGAGELGAFSSIVTVVLPYGLQALPTSAFRDCLTLSNVVIPATVSQLNYACLMYLKAKRVVIPEGVTAIPQSCFDGCRVEEFQLPSSLISIDSTGLGSPMCSHITLPSALITLNNVFYGWNFLRDITIPSSVISFSQNVFYMCYSLESIVFEGDVSDLRGDSISLCYSLKLLDFSNNTSVPILSTGFDLQYLNSLLKIVVPDALYDDWIVATNWVTAANYIYKESEIYPSQQS